jgi:anti-anti-sigma factor
VGAAEVPLSVMASPAPICGPCFDVRVFSSNTVANVELMGELDIAGVDRLREVLESLRCSPILSVILDLAQLSFVDLSGLRMLAAGCGRLRGAGVAVRVRDPQDQFHRMAALAGVRL